MDSFKIFEAFSNERKSNRNSRSVWSKKDAVFQHRFRHESGQTQGDAQCTRSGDIGSADEAEIEGLEGLLGEVTISSNSNTLPYSVQDDGIRRPEIDEYRH